MDTLSKIYSLINISPREKMESRIDLPNFGRTDLANLFHELEYKIGAEIGVESGEYSEVICMANPYVKLYSIDAWKAHRAYRDHTSQEKLNQFYENSKKRLAPYNCTLVKKFSMDALKDFKDRSLDFVYIDGNHKFVEIANDLHHWGKKVKVGGIIAGHDFTKYKEIKAEIHPAYVVPAFCSAYQIEPYFVIGENKDTVKSWFFVQSLQ